jgi:nicotinate-nucleotide adenylyltransferase
MRIGVFGGTFDPVHQGHLILAEQCRQRGRLDRVLFVPAARPPHKHEHPLTPFAQRVEMLTLAIAGQPAFAIDECEKERPGPSYTVDTLRQLHRDHPDDELVLLLGSDSLTDLAGWRDPAGIMELAELFVIERRDPPRDAFHTVPAPARLPATARIQRVSDVPLIDISSRDLRRRVAEGLTIRYLVPRAVECYIEAHHLYRPEPPRP